MQKTFNLILPLRLKALRSTQTQADMARNLQINQQTYARWELGDRQPKLQDLCKIALHFGVSTDWLLGIPEKQGHSINATGSAVAINGSTATNHQAAGGAACAECAVKDAELERLNKIIDRLLK